jgi:hypothetical protein
MELTRKDKAKIENLVFSLLVKMLAKLNKKRNMLTAISNTPIVFIFIFV